MKKKRNIQILSILVLIIWVAIAVQLYRYVFAEEEHRIPVKSTSFSPPKRMVDTLPVLDELSRDPFTGKMYTKPKTQTISTKNTMPFPEVQFLGMIKGKKPVYIVRVDGIQEMLSIGDSFKDIRLLSGTFDEIVIAKGLEQKRIKRIP